MGQLFSSSIHLWANFKAFPIHFSQEFSVCFPLLQWLLFLIIKVLHLFNVRPHKYIKASNLIQEYILMNQSYDKIASSFNLEFPHQSKDLSYQSICYRQEKYVGFLHRSNQFKILFQFFFVFHSQLQARCHLKWPNLKMKPNPLIRDIVQLSLQ